MKILHVVGDSKFGGGSIIIGQIVSSQLENGDDVHVLTTDSQFSRYVENLGAKVISIECIHRNYNLITDANGIYKLWRYLSKHIYDVVHTHTTKAGFIGRLASRISGVKIIVHTVHGFPFSESSRRIKILFFSLLEKILYKLSSSVVFVSEYHLCWAKSLGIVNDERGVAIKNGIDITGYDTSIDILNSKSRNGSIKIVYVGRLVKEKGIFDLLDSYREIIKVEPNIDLFLVGDGPDFDSLKEYSSFSPNIHFTGFVSNATEYLSSSDIFVLPSYREGLSISAIESQGYGIPSILSDIGGNREVSDMGRCALLFPVGDSEKLSEQLLLLINDKELRYTLSELSKENYSNKYTRRKMTNNYLQLYRELE